jgi:hypothetical protein
LCAKWLIVAFVVDLGWISRFNDWGMKAFHKSVFWNLVILV